MTAVSLWAWSVSAEGPSFLRARPSDAIQRAAVSLTTSKDDAHVPTKNLGRNGIDCIREGKTPLRHFDAHPALRVMIAFVVKISPDMNRPSDDEPRPPYFSRTALPTVMLVT